MSCKFLAYACFEEQARKRLGRKALDIVEFISHLFLHQNDVVIYTLDNHTLVKKTTIRVNAGGRVSAVAYSPDGAHLAIGSANRTVDVYDTTNYQV